MAAWTDCLPKIEPTFEAALLHSFLPFWNRAFDGKEGGFFTCWNNAGTELISHDKYTWSQGRCLWAWSRATQLARLGLLPTDAHALATKAELTYRFLSRHAFLDNGECAFLLSQNGEKKEPFPGSGYATSIYADCFVVMGFAEFARTTGQEETLDQALRLFDHVEDRIRTGNVPTAPQPIPPGYEAHAITMITLNVAWVLSEACLALHHDRATALRQRCMRGVEYLFLRFVEPDGTLFELRANSDTGGDSLLTRHINPGHAVEGLWIVLLIAAREGRSDWIASACRSINQVLTVGWDQTFGGLLHYTDYQGGEPKGKPGDSTYEASVRKGWDKKLWWVHSEAIYATLLAYRLTGRADMLQWIERIYAYTFSTFPHPDPLVGEWIQIRDRQGRPIESVVALPVKDPYHILRMLLLSLELFRKPEPWAA